MRLQDEGPHCRGMSKTEIVAMRGSAVRILPEARVNAITAAVPVRKFHKGRAVLHRVVRDRPRLAPDGEIAVSKENVAGEQRTGHPDLDVCPPVAIDVALQEAARET